MLNIFKKKVYLEGNDNNELKERLLNLKGELKHWKKEDSEYMIKKVTKSIKEVNAILNRGYYLR